ncbi:outer membrane protein assembly factor BamB family protein [Pontiella sulfatireligans]|uniref:Serine/threonine-protein kinase AfsK n=1 Tax=Pontiella sulfatireligans TaxID=2750658 RepID=A0A6C2UN99_9BACT|nr:PQQ-binding-like beta-propeller repeat protein [Pontiella sulfatireligans]VGO21745.1 Serine/threonine-protein kinase AfsK [Pontiella sulfatireligans]
MILSKMITLLACCATAGYGEWNTYHGGGDLRGVSDAIVPPKPQLLWRYSAGGEVYSTPVSDGKRIFFSAKKGQVVALDLNGSKVWKKSFSRTNDAGAAMPVRFEAPLACADGLVFAATTRGTLHALDAKTGEEKWCYESGGIITGSPNFVPRKINSDRKDAKTQRTEKLSVLASSRSKQSAVVVLDQSEGSLHCLDVQTGKRIWKTEGVERCDGAPGIGNGQIVFGSCLAALHVYGADGKHLKDIEVGGDGQIAGGVAVDGKLAFAGTRDGGLICADLDAGDIVWSSDESEDQTFSTPSVTDKLVVYSSDDGLVYAVERVEGKTVWKFDTGGLPYSPVVAGDKVVVSADGVLYLLKLEDGAKLWSTEVSDDATAPAIIGGLIVVGADDGTVSAWGPPPTALGSNADEW